MPVASNSNIRGDISGLWPFVFFRLMIGISFQVNLFEISDIVKNKKQAFPIDVTMDIGI